MKDGSESRHTDYNLPSKNGTDPGMPLSRESEIETKGLPIVTWKAIEWYTALYSNEDQVEWLWAGICRVRADSDTFHPLSHFHWDDLREVESCPWKQIPRQFVQYVLHQANNTDGVAASIVPFRV
jgi:hypothetical protein